MCRIVCIGTFVLVFIDLKICLADSHVHITPLFVLFISSNDNQQCRTFSVKLTHLHSIFFPWWSTPHVQWFHPPPVVQIRDDSDSKVMTLKASLLRVAFLSKGIKTSWYHVHVVHAVEHEHKQSMSLRGRVVDAKAGKAFSLETTNNTEKNPTII